MVGRQQPLSVGGLSIVAARMRTVIHPLMRAAARFFRHCALYSAADLLVNRRGSMKTIAVSAWIGLLLAPGLAAAQKAPTTHELKASPTTVHRGFFDASLKPVLTIDSGDIVRLETASGNPRYFESLGVPKARIPAELYAVFEGVEDEGRGDHTFNGPIGIRGAEPDDMLRDDTYMLLSAAMDLVVTQAVDGTKGIHAMMPKGIFR
jgi:hypothetical protein